MPAFSLRQIHSPVNRREKAHFLFFIFPFSHIGFKRMLFLMSTGVLHNN